VADSCGDGDVLWLRVGDGLAEGAGLSVVEAGSVDDDVLAGATEPVVAGVSGRTQTYRAATARNSTTSTRVEVRGRCPVTGCPRAHVRCRGRPGR
jgi:hypothetical protein